MSNNFDASKLVRMAEEFLEGREFFVSAVLERVREASNAFPHDGAIRTAQLVLEKKASREGSLATMSQNDFQRLYTDVSGLGNTEVFRELLGDLLRQDGPSAVAHYNNELASSLRSSGTEVDLVDPDLAESFAGLFDAPSNVVRGSFIDNGRKGVELELTSLGFLSPSVEVAAKNDQFVVYAAAIDSSNGRFAALVPAEIKMGTVLMPSVFVSGGHFVELNRSNLLSYAQEVAQVGAKDHPQKILEALTAAATQQDGMEKTASVQMDGNSIVLAAPSIYQAQIEDDRPTELELTPEVVSMPQELEHLTEGMIRDVLVEAGLSFDAPVIASAKNVISSELQGMGIPYGKISVASEFDSGILISATLKGLGGAKTIDVPVEIVNGQPLMPSVFTSGVVAKPFEERELKAFAMGSEGTFNAIMSDKYGMTFPELHKFALKNAAFGNFVEVEESLAVIAERFGDQYHKFAFDDLMGLLNAGFNEEQPAESVDRYLKEAMDKARDQESNIKMSGNLLYLYPEE